MTQSYFKPKWGPIHDKAVEEFEKKSSIVKTKTVDEIVSVFFK